MSTTVVCPNHRQPGTPFNVVVPRPLLLRRRVISPCDKGTQHFTGPLSCVKKGRRVERTRSEKRMAINDARKRMSTAVFCPQSPPAANTPMSSSSDVRMPRSSDLICVCLAISSMQLATKRLIEVLEDQLEQLLLNVPHMPPLLLYRSHIRLLSAVRPSHLVCVVAFHCERPSSIRATRASSSDDMATRWGQGHVENGRWEENLRSKMSIHRWHPLRCRRTKISGDLQVYGLAAIDVPEKRGMGGEKRGEGNAKKEKREGEGREGEGRGKGRGGRT